MIVGVGFFFFFLNQEEEGKRDEAVTGVQTCALPIYIWLPSRSESQISYVKSLGQQGGQEVIAGISPRSDGD